MPIVKMLLGEIGTEWKRIVEELVAENGKLLIVGEAEKPVDILLQARKANADVVVLSQELQGGEPGVCSHLLLEYPNVVVVLVPSEDGPNVLCRMALYREIREASSEVFRDMLRKLEVR